MAYGVGQETQSCGKTDWNYPSHTEPLSFALYSLRLTTGK